MIKGDFLLNIDHQKFKHIKNNEYIIGISINYFLENLHLPATLSAESPPSNLRFDAKKM